MNVAMVGTGYVGLVTGALFADRGNKVICVDKNQQIVEKLELGDIHIFEPGLREVVERCVKQNTLSFTTNLKEAILNSEIIFLAVGTPSRNDGAFDLGYLISAAEEVGKLLNICSGFKVVVCKSTVPQGTSDILQAKIKEQISDESKVEWAYVANPETLAEGTAVKDFSSPDRIIIGTKNEAAFELMSELYHPFNIKNDRIMRGSPADAELAKLFSNTVLAGRIAMINEMARIADVTPGADMDIIRRMVCEDSRIGYKFMFPSPGYGGSCFPKDVQGLVSKSNEMGYAPYLLSQIHLSNEEQKNYMGEKVFRTLSNLESPVLAIWGLTFKPNTDDMRDASSIPIINHLVKSGVKVIAYDPESKKARELFGDTITFVNDRYLAVKSADALMLLTEWREFDAPDFSILKEKMKGRILFDFRNRWLAGAANRYGFAYYGVGRQYPLQTNSFNLAEENKR